MLRASMQVLIKRIQKRGASSFVWRCGRGSFGGVNLIPPPPVPCGTSALFPRFTTEPPSCTCVPEHQEKPSGQSEEEDWEALNSFISSFHLFSLHPCQPQPSRLSLTGEVINFIYTLIRPSNESLSLWVVGVKGLWGSSRQPLLRFSRLIATRLGNRQNRLGAMPSHP